MCKGKDQLDKVPNPARGQLTGNVFFDGARLRGYVQLNTHTHPWEDQCEWHRMTRMTGPDYAVMCN